MLTPAWEFMKTWLINSRNSINWALVFLLSSTASTCSYRKQCDQICKNPTAFLNLELNNSGDRSIIMITINNRDLDSILLCYHDYLSIL